MMMYHQRANHAGSCWKWIFFLIFLLLVFFLTGQNRCKANEQTPVPDATKINKTLISLQDERPSAKTTEPTPRIAATLAGKIVDLENRPVLGAMVALSIFPFFSTLSDKDGNFSLEAAPSAEPIQLEITKEGYFPIYVAVPSASGINQTPPVLILKPIPPAPTFPQDAQHPHVAPNAVVIEADTLFFEQETDTYRARGEVLITYAEGVLSAGRVDLYHARNEAVAEEQVVMHTKDGDILEGEKVWVDTQKKTGVADAGRVFMAKTHFYIRGDRIEKRNDATYFIVNAEATACDGDAPDWHFAGKELDVTIDGYGTLTHGRFYARKVPVLYAPYMFFPVKTTRQSGFLFPERMAYSQDKLGWDVSIPFYWAISPSADATFYQRYMSERGLQEGVEFRYALSEDTFGHVYGDFLFDHKKINEKVGNLSRDWQEEHRRWAFYLNHQTRFDPTFSLRADIAKVSDSFYFKDFSSYNYFQTNYSQNRLQRYKQISFVADDSLSFLDSTVRLTKDWQHYNLTALIKSTQDLTLDSNDGTLQKYPEISLSGIKQRLFGMPVYYELSGVYDYFYRGQGQKGSLLDVYPTLSMPLGLGSFFQVTPFAGVRSLIWSRDDGVDDGLSKQGNREVYTTGAVANSELHRVFHIGGEKLDKIRHAIRPEVTYIYSPYARQENIPNYVAAAPQANAVTTALSQRVFLNGQTEALTSDQSSVTYSLTNTLTARFHEKGGGKRYAEVLRFKVAETYNIKEASRETTLDNANRQPFSDINIEVDFKPFSYLTFMARNFYSVYNTTWSQANYDLALNDTRGDSASVTYRYTQNMIEETNLILKAVVTKSLDLTFRLKRDHLNDRNIEKSVGFDYRRQCWTIGFDYGDRVDGAGNPDRIYAFRLSLYGL